MVFVGCTARYGDQDHADQVVQHVEPRLQRRAEHGERAGSKPDEDLDQRDEGVENENDEQRSPYGRRACVDGLT